MKALHIIIAFIMAFICIASQANSNHDNSNNPQSPSDYPDSRAVCILCPTFACPPPTGPTGATGITGITGCSGCTCSTSNTICCINLTQSTIQTLTTVCETINNLLSVSGNLQVANSLSTCADALFDMNNCVGRDKDVGGNLQVGGAAVVIGQLHAEDTATIDNFLSVSGPQVVNGNIQVTGQASITGAITAQQASFGGLLTAATGIIVTNGETINSGGLTILNSGCSGCLGASINGNVCVVGDQINNGDLLASDTLTVDEIATLNTVTIGPTGTLIMNGTVNFNTGLLIASGNQTINPGANLNVATGNLTVGNSSTFNQLTANDGLTVLGGLTVNEGLSITTGDLTVDSGDMILGGTLDVEGSISGANLGTFDTLTITDTLNSVSPAGPGALVDLGGAGVAQDIWIGGSIYFTAPVSVGGIPTALDYYEVACFSTPFTWGGTVSPALYLTIKIVRVGNLVNLIIPPILISNAGPHVDVITSTLTLPNRFRPFSSVRGPASTIIYNNGVLTGQLGEFNVDPSGTITLGLPGSALGPQRISSSGSVQSDSNTITYNINGCTPQCKLPFGG
jgi:hypothetical protein